MKNVTMIILEYFIRTKTNPLLTKKDILKTHVIEKEAISLAKAVLTNVLNHVYGIGRDQHQ